MGAGMNKDPNCTQTNSMLWITEQNDHLSYAGWEGIVLKEALQRAGCLLHRK